MTYFHYTHPRHLPSILRDQTLRTTESNVGAPYPVSDGAMGEGFGPPVVWLLDAPIDVDGELSPTLHGLYPEKRQVQFEVDVPAIRWVDWLWTAQMSPDWRRIFVQRAGGEEAAASWFVFPAPIRRRRWVSLAHVELGSLDMTDGRVAG